MYIYEKLENSVFSKLPVEEFKNKTTKRSRGRIAN